MKKRRKQPVNTAWSNNKTNQVCHLLTKVTALKLDIDYNFVF